MHAVFFGIKRAHLEVVHRLARGLLKGTGLTAARFDLMRIVCLRPGVRQVSIRWLLGVSAPTVSRMVKALEESGLLERNVDHRDCRCRVVRPTAAGREAVAMAMARTVDNRAAELAVARCATGDGARGDRAAAGSREEAETFIEKAKGKVAVVAGVVAAARKALFDRAPYPHPWRTGDLVDFAISTVVDGQLRYGDESPLEGRWVESWLAS